MVQPCFICSSSSGDEHVQCLRCSDSPFFCCNDHLLLHHPQDQCLPFSIQFSEDSGRFLVASRDISPGELVLSEKSLIWGPNHTDDLVCLECLTSVTETDFCLLCGYPLCEEHQDSAPLHHTLECSVFRDEGIKLDEKDRECMEELYPCVAVIRSLLLAETSKTFSNCFDKLMDHKEERLAERDKYIEPYREEVINKLLRMNTIQTSEEEICRLLGVLDVNCLAVRGKDGPYKGRGIFPTACLMNHSCICNTRNIITGKLFQC